MRARLILPMQRIERWRVCIMARRWSENLEEAHRVVEVFGRSTVISGSSRTRASIQSQRYLIELPVSMSPHLTYLVRSNMPQNIENKTINSP